jgi:hypothetical protein
VEVYESIMNNMLQLFIELIGLYVLFVIFRAAVLKAFSVQSIEMPLSGDSIRALKRFRFRYIVIFVFLILLLTPIIWYLLNVLFLKLHHEPKNEILIIEGIATFLPALLLAMISASYFGRWLNAKLQADGLSFFFEGYDDELHGFDQNQLKKWQVLLGLCLSMFLLVGQYFYYLRISATDIYLGRGMFETEQVYPISDIKITDIKKTGTRVKRTALILPDDTIYLDEFRGKKELFLASIKKRRAN